MELVINSRGTSVRKVDERFLISLEGKKQEIAAKQIDRILITTSASITTDAIKLATENNIDLVFLEYSGRPFGRVWHSKLGSITTIRRKQLMLNKNSQGLILIKGFVGTKLNNHIKHLDKLKLNKSKSKIELINESIDEIKGYKKILEQLEDNNVDFLRGTIEGYEGLSARVYFKTLANLIPDKYEFKGRSRNPAKDEFNCMLNYAYGVLYSKVEHACVITGLDPYIGVMHTDNYNKKSFVFDLIEIYRSYMDEIVFSLFSKRLVKKSMFDDVVGGGYYLNKAGKELIISTINDRFEEVINYRGGRVKVKNTIIKDCHSIANWLLEEDV